MQLPAEYAYLDWAATTPLSTEASSAMAPFMEPGIANIAFGMNANSLHTPGRNAFVALEEARATVARCTGAGRPSEIVFTSGATEADNMSIRGIVAACRKRKGQHGAKDFVPHIITCEIEHDAVLSAIPELRANGCDVTILKPDVCGFVHPDALRKVLRPETVLVSIMWANNEVGTIQDVEELAEASHAAGALFHTDATQAVGKVTVDLAASKVDAASFCAHKICGPKGVGALYLKTGTPCEPLLVGGGQELGLRSGTQNVAGVVGFAAACKQAVQTMPEERLRLSALRDRLYAGLCETGKARPSIAEAPGNDRFLPNIVNVIVPGYESETLILQFDLAGFAVSGGSACSTGSLDPSHVLTALGIGRDDALCSLRVSIGRYTTEDEIENFIRAFNRIVV